MNGTTCYQLCVRHFLFSKCSVSTIVSWKTLVIRTFRHLRQLWGEVTNFKLPRTWNLTEHFAYAYQMHNLQQFAAKRSCWKPNKPTNHLAKQVTSCLYKCSLQLRTAKKVYMLNHCFLYLFVYSKHIHAYTYPLLQKTSNTQHHKYGLIKTFPRQSCAIRHTVLHKI